ncbi:MAG: energy-coupling factor ABC transporter ATP-binding protein [Gammaproteobacteria bacterium]
MSSIALVANGIDYTYPGGIQALRALDLTIARGQKLAILGANGSGKTTLLLHLNGTLRPSSGRILLDGYPLSYDRRSLVTLRRRVGLVLQDPDDQLFSANVYQDVSFGPLNLGLSEAETRARIDAALEVLHIANLRDRATHMLSFGQKKRVAIAGMLAMEPEILVLDEPTAGLDSHGVRHLLSVLQTLQETGTTLVFSTHDVDLAYRWADQVAVFADGKVLKQGETVRMLGDQELLHAARLKVPLLLEIAWALYRASPGSPITEPPRSKAALLQLLRQRIDGVG